MSSSLSQRRSVGWIAAGLIVAVFSAFGAALSFGFVNYDDGQYVYANEHISGGLTADGLKWALTTPHGANWHPLTSFSHMLDCQLFGLNAFGHHAGNLLLHAAAALVLFAALRRMTGALWRSALVAALFAIHPLRAESVVWISERKDVLSGLFFALTLWSYAAYAQTPSVKRYVPVVFFLLLGLLSKPMLVTLPCVLLLFDVWPLRRTDVRRVLLEKVPLFLLSAGCGAVTVWAQGKAVATVEALPFWSRVGNAALSYCIYVKQLFFPVGLAVLYPAHTDGHPAVDVIFCVILLLLITGVVIRQWKARPYLTVGWLFYLGTLVPVIGILQVGSQAHADRYTYLPHIGLLILLVWGVAEFVRDRRRRIVAALFCVALLAGLIVLTRLQTAVWKDSMTLWTHTLQHTENNYTAHGNLGAALLVNGDAAAAAEQLEKAVEFEPRKAELHNNLAVAYAECGRFGEAAASLQTALQLAKDTQPPEVVRTMLLRLVDYQNRAAQKKQEAE